MTLLTVTVLSTHQDMLAKLASRRVDNWLSETSKMCQKHPSTSLCVWGTVWMQIAEKSLKCTLGSGTKLSQDTGIIKTETNEKAMISWICFQEDTKKKSSIKQSEGRLKYCGGCGSPLCLHTEVNHNKTWKRNIFPRNHLYCNERAQWSFKCNN